MATPGLKTTALDELYGSFYESETANSEVARFGPEFTGEQQFATGPGNGYSSQLTD